MKVEPEKKKNCIEKEASFSGLLAKGYFLSAKKNMGEAAAIRVMQHAKILHEMSAAELAIRFPKPT